MKLALELGREPLVISGSPVAQYWIGKLNDRVDVLVRVEVLAVQTGADLTPAEAHALFPQLAQLDRELG
jgi:hypothetical protein